MRGRGLKKNKKTHEFNWGSVAAMVAKSCNKSDTAKSSQQVQLALSYSSALWHRQCAQSSLSFSLSLYLYLYLFLSLSVSSCLFSGWGWDPTTCWLMSPRGQRRENLGCPSGQTLEHKGRVKWRGWSPVRDTRVEYSWADETAVRNQPVVDAESHCKLQQKENIKEKTAPLRLDINVVIIIICCLGFVFVGRPWILICILNCKESRI